MWTRTELKSNAKMVLKRTYWLSFAVLLVAGIVGGIGDSVSSVLELAVELQIQVPENLVAAAGGLALFVSIFVSGPLVVGTARFFLQTREYDTEFSVLFSGFNGSQYWSNIRTMIMKGIYITLWTFLLIIPGIVKAYEYYFVHYILAENPNISTKRALQLSKAMTDGYKWNIFVLELSFLGWYLLGALCFGVGVLFVAPYVEATMAELYSAQRAYVLKAGIITEEELCGVGSYNNY